MSTLPKPHLVARQFSLWARLPDGAASFDASGRLMTARRGGRFLRRGLDRSMVEMTRVPGSPWPWTARRTAHDSGLHRDLLSLLDGYERHAEGERALTLLERARAGLADEYAADSLAFADAVGPVPIVPSNHSRAVVLRLTEGCQYNACRFCTLYAKTPFRVRGPEEFREHARSVLGYFGEGAGVRPAIWVGDASALEAGADGFAEALELLRQEIRVAEPHAGGIEPHLQKGNDPHLFEGIYAFADAPRASRLRPAEVARLARLGVRRMYIGVETGHEPLLRALKKPHTNDQVVESVRRLHRGGIAAGIILMVGIGGRALADSHREDTAALVARLDLEPEDFLFLSPLDSASREERHPVAGPDPFDERSLAVETELLRRTLKRASRIPNVRIADYQLESFVY